MRVAFLYFYQTQGFLFFVKSIIKRFTQKTNIFEKLANLWFNYKIRG